MLNFRLNTNRVEQDEISQKTSLLTLYPLETDQPRPFILVLPGGGYQHLAKHEGEPVAQWLNNLGIHAGVLDYQVGDFNVSSLLNDVEEALKWIREAPKAWNVISDKVGMIGFSAGGHLASIFSTTRAEKPNLLLLGYPVITFQESHSHKGSLLHFLETTHHKRSLTPFPQKPRWIHSHLQPLSGQQQTMPAFPWRIVCCSPLPCLIREFLLNYISLKKGGMV